MVEYWIRLGVAGFRVDGAPFFSRKRQPDEGAVHEVLHDIHAWAQGIHEETCLLPEANLDADELVPYVANGHAQMLFNFLGNQYIFLAMATAEASHIQTVIGIMPHDGSTFQWLNLLRNHDELSLDRLSKEQQRLILDAFPLIRTHISSSEARAGVLHRC